MGEARLMTGCGLLSLRLRAMAKLNAQLAAALTGRGQDELRKHLNDCADLMIQAVAFIARAKGDGE